MYLRVEVGMMDKIYKFLKKYSVTIGFYVLLYFVYKYTTENGVASEYLFPSVESIKNAFKEHGVTLFKNMIASFQLLIPSLTISTSIALIVGIFLGMHKKIHDHVNPIMYSFSVIPAILLSPFVLLLAPSFKVASIILIVYVTVWPTLFATITGIMTIDKRYLDKAETLELHGLKKMIKVVLPAASPSILSGFVSSIRSSFLILVYAEMYGAKYGMGYFVNANANIGLFEKVWCGFLFMVVVLVSVMQFFEILKSKILKWSL